MVGEGEYLRVVVEQAGVDVAARLLSPEGEQVLAADGVGGRMRPEVFSLVAVSGGEYRLVVTPHDRAESTGRFSVTLEEIRAARAEDGDRVRAEAALGEAGHLWASDDRENLPEALRKGEESLALWRGIGDRRGEFQALMELANIRYKLKEFDRAFTDLKAAVAIAKDLGDLRGEARALRLLAHLDEEEPPAVRREYFTRARQIYESLDETEDLADVVFRMGGFEYRQGNSPEALVLLEQALELAEKSNSSDLIADILNGIGSVYSQRGESNQGLLFLEQALVAARKVENRGAEAATLTNIALLLRRRGQLQVALDRISEALALNERRGDTTAEGRVRNHLGALHVDLGDRDEALKQYELALRLARLAHNQSLEITVQLQIGQLHLAEKQWEAALDRFGQARAIAAEDPDVRTARNEALALHGIAVAKLNLGKTEEAIQSLETALPLRKAAGDRMGEASTLLELGNAYRAQKDLDRALASLGNALQIAEQAEASFVQAAVLFSLAKLERDRDNLQEALKAIEQSLKILESVRSNLVTDRLKSSFLASRRSYYDLYVDLLVRLDQRHPDQGYRDRALAASERGRARALLDLLAEGRLDLTGGISPELKQEEAEIIALLSQIQGELMDELSRGSRQVKLSALHERLTEVEDKRQDIERRIRLAHPRYAEVRYPSPVTLPEIQNRLGRDAALLEYSLGEDGAYLFVVTREALTVHRLTAADQIPEEVRRVGEGVKVVGRRNFSAYTLAAHRLYRQLIEPVRPVLAGKRRLIIVPDGPLHFLSFDVLLTEAVQSREAADLPYLLRDFSVSYVPSASVLSWLENPQYAPAAENGRRFVAFADPWYGPEEEGQTVADDVLRSQEPVRAVVAQTRGLGPVPRLKGTAKEVEMIASRYPPGEVQVYERTEANEDNIKNNPLVSSARWLHFATHGVLNERQPELSGLRLARTGSPGDDGILQVHEIFNLSLKADMVVLSACETGLGKEVTGEGLVGVTRAFLYAGTPSVVVSLWPVADAQTPELMIRFYEEMDRRQDKAEALRQAKMAMIQGGGAFAHPYYWAPFILVGKP